MHNKRGTTWKGLHSLFKCILNTAVKSDYGSVVWECFSVAAKQNYEYPSVKKKKADKCLFREGKI